MSSHSPHVIIRWNSGFPGWVQNGSVMHPVLSQGGFLEKGEISALVMLQFGLVQLFQVVPNSTKTHRIAAEIVTFRELV